MIDDGNIIFDGPISRLRDEYGTNRTLVITLADSYEDVQIEGADVESREGNVVRLRFDRRRTSAEALIRRALERYALSDIAIVEPDINSIVGRIYREGYTESAIGSPS